MSGLLRARVPGSTLIRAIACLLCLAFVAWSALPAERTPPVRFAVIGDSGTGHEDQQRIARQMVAWHDRLPYSLVLMLGDNIYGGPLGTGGGNRSDFEEKFDRPYAALLDRGVVFRAALGNHDTQRRDGRDLIEAYDRFHIDGPQGYYSFTAGEWFPAAGAPGPGKKGEAAPLVEFLVINTIRLEKDKKDPKQLDWLAQALEGSRARWRILYGHHPLYSTGERHGGDARLRAKLEPLLAKPRNQGQTSSPAVQVVMAGHDHIYQRFEPQKGVVYFVCGSSGRLRRGNARKDATVAAVEDRQHVFMLWEATSSELRFRAINEAGQAFDCGVLRPGRAPTGVECARWGSGP